MLAAVIMWSLAAGSLRALVGVVDRHCFGLKRESILIWNTLNNALPFLLLASIVFFWRPAATWDAITDIKLVIFSISVQICAFAFSWAYRSLSAPKTVAISRLADGVIPLALLACGASLTLSDYIFAISLSMCSIPVCYFAFKELRAEAWRPGLAIVCALIVQAMASEFLFAGKTPDVNQQIINTTALFFWRSLFSASMVVAIARPNPIRNLVNALRDAIKTRLSILIIRAGLTLLSQASLLLALSRGNRVIAWPILNSAALFSVLFSWVFLHEKSRRVEVGAAVAFIVVAALKAVV